MGKRAGIGRGRVFGALTGLMVAGSAVLVAGAPAEAAPDGTTQAITGGSTTAPVIRRDQLPKGAVKATGERPTLGAHGAAFQKPVITTKDLRPKIIGGTVANAADHPYIVGLQSWFLLPNDNGDLESWYSYCTGTILSPTKVLTAGHCAVDLPFGTTYVIAGRNNMDTDTGGYVELVSSTWTHQNFNLQGTYEGQAPRDDVSVLTLKGPLPDVYTPISLVAQGDNSKTAAGTSAKIVGYGSTSSGVFDPGVLREATVPIQANTTCSTQLGSQFDAARMLCAGDTTNHVDTCGGDSGGPLIVDGVEVGITDWGYDPCGSYYGAYERVSYYSDIIKQDLTRPSLVNLDWSGDGHSDLMAVDANGNLVEYSGSGLGTDGYGGFSGAAYANSGFSKYTKAFRVTNWNGDGTPSIMGMDSNGNLFQYRSDGVGNFTTGAVKIGQGWGVFADIMVTNNWTGDGRPNLLGRKSNGDLFLYTSDGNGGWLNNGIGIKIGIGWNRFNTVLTPGNWEGDGYQALIGRDAATGDLLLYKSDGHGGWLNGGIGIKIGTGWNALNIFMCPGDWNGDNMIDMIGRNSAGDLLLYMTDAHGKWLNGGMPQKIGNGWGVYKKIF